MEQEQQKRHVAFKLRISDLLKAQPIFDGERFRFLELEGKSILRVNLIANIIEKYSQDGEKKFGSITLDDGSGQIKVKVFGDDLVKINELNQGDTIQVIGLARSWNNEVYLTPEIMKRRDTRYLLVRKLECDMNEPKKLGNDEILALREKLLEIVKREEAKGGADTESIVLEMKSPPEAINAEIKALLEEGVIYEPRPGRIRYLG